MLSDQVIQVAGFPIVRTTSHRLANHLLKQVAAGTKAAVLFANTNFIVRCRYLLIAMSRDDVTIVNDGLGLDLAVRFIHRKTFRENMCGTDFVPYLFSKSTRPLRIFMLGSRPDVLEEAARHVRDVLCQDVVGTCDGYDGMRTATDLVETINRSGAEVVLVALGNPTQEEWILHNIDGLRANAVMGVGALFDFWSGRVRRAPKMIRRLRLEWLFRLCLEPRRLLARYTVDIVTFLLLCRKFHSRDSLPARPSAAGRPDWKNPQDRA